MHSKNFDVVIVGAGVIGHSIAFRLKQMRPNLSVGILGDSMNSLMASRAAAGMLAPFGETEEANSFFKFCRRSLEAYPPFIEELTGVGGVPVFLSMAGSIMPDISFRDHWQERLKFFQENNIAHEIWTGSQLRKKVPYLTEECQEVLWVDGGQVNNRQLHDALIAANKKLGVESIAENVTGFIRDKKAVAAVVTDRGQVQGDRFVLASGSWSTQLAQVLEVSLPVKPVKGQMCRLQVADDRLDYTVHGIMTYIAPWRGGHGMVVGSTMEDRGFDPGIEQEVIQGLIDRAARILPCLKESELIETWTGLRPAAEDQMPIMGRSGRYENLYYSSGHFRNGILQTPHQADYMTGIILETLPGEIAEFSPTRYNL